MKPFVNNILNHAVNITEDIGQVLSLVSAPGRRSRSMAASHAANASTSGGNKSSLGKSIDTTRKLGIINLNLAVWDIKNFVLHFNIFQPFNFVDRQV